MTETTHLLLTRSLPVPAARALEAWTGPARTGLWRAGEAGHDVSAGGSACGEGRGWGLGCHVDHLTALAAS